MKNLKDFKDVFYEIHQTDTMYHLTNEWVSDVCLVSWWADGTHDLLNNVQDVIDYLTNLLDDEHNIEYDVEDIKNLISCLNNGDYGNADDIEDNTQLDRLLDENKLILYDFEMYYTTKHDEVIDIGIFSKREFAENEIIKLDLKKCKVVERKL